ncbi:MAG TPA: HlyD family efflux transporter periplasmic adaptor subunit, partial [Candidatus Eisenbacteria bacterium]
IAPQAGVVVRRSAEPGAQIADAAEILGLVAARSIVFEAHVPAAASGRVRPGEDAAVIEPSRPPRPATVQRILPMASGADQTTLVWLAPRSESPPPELERFGNAAIVVGTPHRGLAVPDSAVVEDDLTGERRVAVVDSAGRIAWTTVTLGPSLEGWRELLHPALLPGTRVVLEGQRGLPDGTRVTPQP